MSEADDELFENAQFDRQLRQALGSARLSAAQRARHLHLLREHVASMQIAAPTRRSWRPSGLRRPIRGWAELAIIASILILVVGGIAAFEGLRSPSNPEPANPAVVSASPSPAASPTDVWATLHRPLHLPTLAPGAPCPVSSSARVIPDLGVALGDGPVYPAPFPNGVYIEAPVLSTAAGGWAYMKMVITIRPDYVGPVLMRGRQVDGTGELRFTGTGADYSSMAANDSQPAPELKVPQGGSIDDAPGWTLWVGYFRVQHPGCYAFQIDGLTFSQVLIFRVPTESLPPSAPSDQGQIPRPSPFALPQDVVMPGGYHLTSQIGVGNPQGTVMTFSSPDRPTVAVFVQSAKSASQYNIRESLPHASTQAGVIFWSSVPGFAGPALAVWDDGEYRYSLSVQSRYSSWTQDELLNFANTLSSSMRAHQTTH